MTRIFGDEQGPDKPSTHALIIGVGDYPRLIGGSSDTKLKDPMGLTQLSSPPISARLFADWVLNTPLTNPAAPVASVEMLLSPHGGYGATTVAAATMDSIKQAFDAWQARCHAHAGNVALFYYCGHGLERGPDRVLLAEDFGASEARVWENAFNFSKTYLGMARCQAGTQVYFVDACRNATTSMVKIDDITSPPLIEPRSTGLFPRDAPVFEATIRGEQAYALPGEATLYTQALLKGLAGRGADRVPGDGRWAIKTDVLQDALRELMSAAEKGQGEGKQRSSRGGETSGSVFLHYLDGTPVVPLTLRCRPGEAIKDARLIVKSHKSGEVPREKPPGAQLDPPEWQVEVSAGSYLVSARFEAGPYQPVDMDDVWVRPPSWTEELKVAP